MRVLDKGHKYTLATLDGQGISWLLQFVKREGPNYPGNVGHYPGTTTQEVLRALIDRMKYVDQQKRHRTNELVLTHLRWSLYELEWRAAKEAGLSGLPYIQKDIIELLPTCNICGHLTAWCNGERHNG